MKKNRTFIFMSDNLIETVASHRMSVSFWAISGWAAERRRRDHGFKSHKCSIFFPSNLFIFHSFYGSLLQNRFFFIIGIFFSPNFIIFLPSRRWLFSLRNWWKWQWKLKYIFFGTSFAMQSPLGFEFRTLKWIL